MINDSKGTRPAHIDAETWAIIQEEVSKIPPVPADQTDRDIKRVKLEKITETARRIAAAEVASILVTEAGWQVLR